MRARLDEEFKKQFKTLVRYQRRRQVRRLREKIRSCIGNSEYKEREPSLEAARRKIEDYMEEYRDWEKESKMKAFSKEGLAATKARLGTEQ